uniref:Meckelin n=1 Tax=Panagrellus redivivus TaxID=6233 RepID=A0A7E4ZZE5_PANRE
MRHRLQNHWLVRWPTSIVNQTLPPSNLTGQCPPCNQNEFIEWVESNDAFIEACVVCPVGTVPTDDKLRCMPCTTATCFCEANPAACDNRGSTITLENGQLFKSTYISRHLAHATEQCSSGQATECQHVANMCVLQNYFRESSNDSACIALDNILRTSSTYASIVPTLMYYNTEASIELARESAISAIFNVNSGSPNTKLDILTVKYALNGTFLGMDSASEGLLHICPTGREPTSGAMMFGREFYQECEIRISDVIRMVTMNRQYVNQDSDTIFHELYLRFIDDANQYRLYPLPILNGNIKTQNSYVNQAGVMNRWVLTRRFFLTDVSVNEDTNPNMVLTRIPEAMFLKVNVQPSRDGRIYPPYLAIKYKEFLAAENNETAEEEIMQSRFGVTYTMDTTKHDKTIEVIMAVFCSTSILWGALRAYAWGRRAGKQIIDASTIIKLILFMCEIISNIFLLVVGCTTVWMTFAYKIQQHYVYVLLTRDQEWIFITYICVALGLRVIALIHLYACLILTETFFIDWERPRGSTPTQTQFTTSIEERIKEIPAAEPRPPVIWRTYFVANEWNELQNYRKTSIAGQLMLLLFVLEYLDFADYAIVQPGLSRGNQPAEYVESRLSRFSVNLVFYLIIGLAQWIVHVLIVEKVMDPFRNFMDFCSVANISVLAMTHPLRGFYIHGRSVHGMADAAMHEMNMFLKREKDNLCALRGLESNSELQTFVVNMPRAFRDKYDEITASLRNPAQTVNVHFTGTDKNTTQVENIAKVYGELNQYMKDVIDHAVPEADYIVTDIKFIDDLLDLELTDTTKQGIFQR